MYRAPIFLRDSPLPQEVVSVGFRDLMSVPAIAPSNWFKQRRQTSK